MKHLKTFEDFVEDFKHMAHLDVAAKESEVNESDLGSITDIAFDGSPEWVKFWKTAKRGDVFKYNPSGIEVFFINKNNLNKDTIKPAEETYGYINGGAEETTCTVIDRKSAKILGRDEFDEEEDYDTIFFTMEGESANKIFMLIDIG